MPAYDYECKTCGTIKETVHRWEELAEPSAELVKETTCCETRMTRLIGAPMVSKINGAYGRENKIAMLKKRAKKDDALPHNVENRKVMNGETGKQF